jgi:hypothetical protein
MNATDEVLPRESPMTVAGDDVISSQGKTKRCNMISRGKGRAGNPLHSTAATSYDCRGKGEAAGTHSTAALGRVGTPPLNLENYREETSPMSFPLFDQVKRAHWQ